MKSQFLDLFGSCVANSQAMRERISLETVGTNSPAERYIARRFTVPEAAKLVKVTPQAIYAAHREGRLPPADTDANGRKLGYSLAQLDGMRQLFGTHPWRKHAISVAVASNKGGSYKSSVVVHTAQCAALMGYRVLVIDTDPQGTLGEYFGYTAKWVDAGRTIAPWMFGKADSLDYAIHPTCWPRLDLIPANQELQRIDREMADMDLPFPPHLMLRAGIDTIADRYDLIIIDGAPNLADGTIAQVFAADVLICPTPAELHDTASTEQFFSLLYGVTQSLPDDQIWAVPDVRILITKLASDPRSSSQAVANKIRATWGGLVLANPVKVTEEVGKAQLRMRTVFEQAKAERSSSSAWKGACAMWEALMEEIMETLIKPRWEE